MSTTKATASTTYSSLKPNLKTGDVIMFMGFNLTGAAIMALEAMEKIEPFTHVGIVVELPTDDQGNTDLYFWHAIPPDAINQFGPDYYKKVQCDGCVMVTLDSVMSWVSQQNTSQAPGSTYFGLIAREISAGDGTRGISDATYLDPLKQFTRVKCGRSFSAPVEEGMVMDYYQGYQEANGTGYKYPPNGTYFCSKLASATFQAAGLLPNDLITNSVLPGHFGSNQSSGKLSWQNGFSFGDDITFTPN